MAKLSASGEDVGLHRSDKWAIPKSDISTLARVGLSHQDLTRITTGTRCRRTCPQQGCPGGFCKGARPSTAFARSGFRRRRAQSLSSSPGAGRSGACCGVKKIFVHAFTDGRDASPTGGADILRECEKALAKSGAQIVTVVGRYFAMDRDRRWDRTKKAWDAIVHGQGEADHEIAR